MGSNGIGDRNLGIGSIDESTLVEYKGERYRVQAEKLLSTRGVEVMHKKRLETAWLLVASLIVFSASGCKVTKERVDKWKAKGDTARLKKCLADKKLSSDIRKRCGLALVSLDKLYGVERMLDRVYKRSASEASKVADPMAKDLLDKVRGLEDEGVRAKDALFVLRRFVSKSVRGSIDEKLVGWILANYTSGATAGEHSARKILKALGQEGGDILARLVPEDHPNLYEIASLVRKTASDKAKDALVARLVGSVQKNQSKLARPEILFAIGQICRPQSLVFLRKQALEGFNYKIRRNALIGLQRCPDPGSIKVAEAILWGILSKDIQNQAVDLPRFSDGKPGVIGQCFNLLDAVGKWPAEKASFVRLISAVNTAPLDDKPQAQKLLIRVQAAQYAIYIGGVDGLKTALQALPDDAYPEIYVNTPVLAIGQEFGRGPKRDKALAVLRGALNNGRLVAKMIAVKALGRIGDPKTDVALLRKVASDRTPLKGWDAGQTLGILAAKAAEKLSAK